MSNLKKAIVLVAAVIFVVMLSVALLSMKLLPKKGNSAEQFYTVNQLDIEYVYVLIVSQKSPFKDNLVKVISDHFYSKSVLFSVIDEAEIMDTEEDFWDKIIIVTAVQNDNVILEIEDFIKNQKEPHKICMVVTTDNGKWNDASGGSVDVITTTSKLKNTGKISGRIIEKIEMIDSIALN